MLRRYIYGWRLIRGHGRSSLCCVYGVLTIRCYPYVIVSTKKRSLYIRELRPAIIFRFLFIQDLFEENHRAGESYDSAMKSSYFTVGKTRRDATRCDVMRRARRGSLPFGLIARQRLRPLGTLGSRLVVVRALARALSQTARSPDSADVVACIVLLHPRLARTWCNYSPQFRVPPECHGDAPAMPSKRPMHSAPLIMRLRLVPPPRTACNYASSHPRFFSGAFRPLGVYALI